MFLLRESDRFIPFGLKMLKETDESVNAAIIINYLTLISSLNTKRFEKFFQDDTSATSKIIEYDCVNVYDSLTLTPYPILVESGYNLDYLNIHYRRRGAAIVLTNFYIFSKDTNLFRIFDKKTNKSLCFNYNNTNSTSAKKLSKILWNPSSTISNTSGKSRINEEIASTVTDLISLQVINKFMESRLIYESSKLLWSKNDEDVKVKLIKQPKTTTSYIALIGLTINS